MVRPYRFAAALLVGALTASSARAQDARLAAISDNDARAAVGSLILAAERQGLPREPLVTKALEGVEKGAAGPRIEAAVRAIAARLVASRSALSAEATPTEIVAGADALAAGVSRDDIRRVHLAGRNRSSTVALGVLAQLAARGVAPSAAALAVTRMVQRNASQAQLLALQRSVQDDVAVGIHPATALDLRARAILGSLPPPGAAAAANAATIVPGKP
jgi:hypothetical protein